MTQQDSESPAYNFESMSDEEFMQAWTDYADEVAEAKAKLQAFSDEHQRRVQAEALQRTLGEMTEEQKEATIKAIRMLPTAIESEEAVGEVGNVPTPETPEGSEQ